LTKRKSNNLQIHLLFLILVVKLTTLEDAKWWTRRELLLRKIATVLSFELQKISNMRLITCRQRLIKFVTDFQ
jgi:hypothetical protein